MAARPRSGTLIVSLLSIVVVACASAARSAAPNAPNLTGTWQSTYHCVSGWCAGKDFPDKITLNQPAGSSSVSGSDQIGSTITGTMNGTTLEFTSKAGGYTATYRVVISADGTSWSGPVSDSNGSSGTDSAQREGGPTGKP